MGVSRQETRSVEEHRNRIFTISTICSFHSRPGDFPITWRKGARTKICIVLRVSNWRAQCYSLVYRGVYSVTDGLDMDIHPFSGRMQVILKGQIAEPGKCGGGLSVSAIRDLFRDL
jgi:hypothetical protein